MNTEGNHGLRIALTFVGGAALGAIAMLLLTPKTGRQVRTEIADYARRGVDRTSQVPQAVKAASGAAKEAFSDSMTDGRQTG